MSEDRETKIKHLLAEKERLGAEIKRLSRDLEEIEKIPTPPVVKYSELFKIAMGFCTVFLAWMYAILLWILIWPLGKMHGQ